MDHEGLGTLFPARLPVFHRVEPAAALAEFVRWFWVPEWDLPEGEVSRQELLQFPACNLVVEAGAATLFGPATRASTRELRGRGWAVGALLRPAATAQLCADPGGIRDRAAPIDAPELVAAVTERMRAPGESEARAAAAAAAFGDWLAGRLEPPGTAALRANRLAELVESDPELLRLDRLAERLGVSTRTLQRIADRHIGLSPGALIRRRRLQQAAARLRDGERERVASIAAELGYADQSHLGAEFRDALGRSPSRYRRDSDPGP